MKKSATIALALLCFIVMNLKAQPVINILASFHSEALDEVRNVRVYLPGDYYAHPADIHYPVIYYLHGWTGNHNAMSEMHAYLQVLMTSGAIEPVIMVAADNWAEPFEGSCYLNSILWGDYEDYNINDVVNWVDATFRTIPERKGRAIIGNSMGGYGAFRYTLKYKDKFCALAANGPTLNFQLLVDNIHTKLLTENSGPPYSYSYQGGGPYTRWMFLLSGAGAPNFNTPQTYINPAIVEYPFNEFCEPIDTILQKLYTYDVLELLHNITPEDSVGILYCCATNDQWQLYEANAALADTLDSLGLPYEFYSHTGGHGMPNEFKQRALIFLDSLLMSPIQMNVGIAENSGLLNHMDFFPNPFTTHTTIEFNLPQTSTVSIQIFNAMGAKVTELHNGRIPAGQQQFRWDAGDLPKGLYFCRVQAGKDMKMLKIIKH
jgi:enterochelin esterase-like enzyme